MHHLDNSWLCRRGYSPADMRKLVAGVHGGKPLWVIQQTRWLVSHTSYGWNLSYEKGGRVGQEPGHEEFHMQRSRGVLK